jgi:hypothetical protein
MFVILYIPLLQASIIFEDLQAMPRIISLVRQVGGAFCWP